MCWDKNANISIDEREVIERRQQYFDEHLNVAETASDEGQDNGRNVYVRMVMNAIHKLKNNKSASEDAIEAKFIKKGPDKLT